MSDVESYTNPSILIGTDELEAILGNGDLRIIDCHINMTPKPEGGYEVASGRADWQAAHIPNSVYVNIGGQLSAKHPALNYMLPSAEQFASVMSELGIGSEHRVVVYSRGSNMWATRLYLMFREFGFKKVQVLNGALDKWLAEGKPTTQIKPSWPSAWFVAKPRAGLFVDKAAVSRALASDNALVLNALSPAVHSGETFHPPYGRRGHITGSVNLFFMRLIDPETHCFLAGDALRAIFKEHGALDKDQLLAYCGGAISATTLAFALHLLGRDDVTVYDGSLSEWGNDESLPMSCD